MVSKKRFIPSIGSSEKENKNSEKNKEENSRVSRRGFLGTTATAAALATGTTLAINSDNVLAQSNNGPSDIEILNFALTLEHLENEFYKKYLNKFNERDFQRSEALNEFGFGIRFTAREYLGDIQEHEKAHVDTLTNTINDLGGSPISKAQEYNFAAPLGKNELETVGEFLQVAQILEATGVDAYAGAAPEIKNSQLIPPALSIHSVEANHAAYLRNLNRENPMPNGFNSAKSISEVKNAVNPIIVQQ